MCKDRGITRPAEGCYHAHHIVPRGYSSKPSVASAQKKLMDAKVSLEDATNGVFIRCDLHAGLHTDLYFQWVARELADTPADGVLVRAKLVDMGVALQAGKFRGR
jgi:hypothetical protein